MRVETQPTQSPLSLVLLPGLDGTGRLFQWFLDALPPRFRPIVVSFPGDANGDYVALEAYVTPLLPRYQPFALLGESFSGPLALRIAARGHANLVAVILVASFIAQPVPWIPFSITHVVRPFIFRLPFPSRLLRWLLMGETPPAVVIDNTMKSLKAVDPKILADRTKAALRVDATEAFVGCSVPILYLGGIRDRLISTKIAERLKAIRPDLECIMLDAPHFLLQREPVAAARAISEFLLYHHPSAP